MSEANDSYQKAVEAAGGFFYEEYHCAEAVAKAVLEALGHDAGECVACATAFGSGFGRSQQEVCGALSGALIVIGHLHGRRAPGQDWQRAASMAVAMRDAFLERHGATKCQTLRERHSPESQMDHCRELVRQATQSLLEILNQPGDGHE